MIRNVIAFALIVVVRPYMVAQAQEATGLNPGYRLLLRPVAQVRADLSLMIEAPELSAREWVVYAAALPALPYQTGVSSTLQPRGELAREAGPAHRPILRRVSWSRMASATRVLR